MDVRKEEVEELLGHGLADAQFQKALGLARRKQGYIYGQEGRAVVLQHWYLVKLTEEYARGLAFSEFTAERCRILREMEKERPAGCMDAQSDTHIVANPAP